MRVDAIRFDIFPPFDSCTLQFPKSERPDLAEVQLITGQNGTGKTRMLCAIAKLLGDSKSLKKRGEDDLSFGGAVEFKDVSYFAWWRALGNVSLQGRLGRNAATELVNKIRPRMSNAFREISITHRMEIPQLIQELATRNEFATAMAFRGTATIQDTDVVALQEYSLKDGGLDLDNQDNSILVSQAITNLVVESALETTDANVSEKRASHLVESLQEAIAFVTGKSNFRFRIVRQPRVQLHVCWDSDSSFPFQLLPDGLRSIIGWLASCVARLSLRFPDHPLPLEIPAVLLIDEPELHLHPEWQRRIIPATQKLLPKSQLFVVTHSPFVVSSVNSGSYVVLREQGGSVVADGPHLCSSGDSFIDAVEDVLGVRKWYDHETEVLLEEFRELRDAVLHGGEGRSEAAKKLRALGIDIASRSDNLRILVAKEFAQIQDILDEIE